VLPSCLLDSGGASHRYASHSVLACCWPTVCRSANCRVPRSVSCRFRRDCEPALRANVFFYWTQHAATVAPMSALSNATSRCAYLTRCVLRLRSNVDRSTGRDLLRAAPRPGPSDSLLRPTFLRGRCPAITPGRLGVCKKCFLSFSFFAEMEAYCPSVPGEFRICCL
jgi:hypothetical protein